MLSATLIAIVLVAVTVLIHGVGFTLILRSLMRSHIALTAQVWPIAWQLIRVSWLLIVVHVAEIGLWSLCFLWTNCFPDAESAFYFSGVTYATIGYGDLVLPKPWRILGPLEGLTGILMCGLSAGLFFAVVSQIYTARVEAKRK